MREWQTSDPRVADAVLERRRRLRRQEQLEEQRKREADPEYRLHRLMRTVDRHNAAADEHASERGGAPPAAAAARATVARAAPPAVGPPPASQVMRDRMRHRSKRRAAPAWAQPRPDG